MKAIIIALTLSVIMAGSAAAGKPVNGYVVDVHMHRGLWTVYHVVISDDSTGSLYTCRVDYGQYKYMRMYAPAQYSCYGTRGS